MRLKVFVKKNCSNCPAAREVAKQFSFSNVYEMDDNDGMAEAAFHSVLCTPSMVLVDENDRVLKSWRCHVPRPTEIARYCI